MSHTCTHTHTQLFGYKKEENPTNCDILDESGGHYDQQDKPITER